ncbi:flagellar hook-length control protein FliK [Bacillus manliponensis]|uniref:flagellar hook-length control protein FliK n=1 Tax=Bacillus manliponensis TaxID=574376 RepID=UPI0035173217
MIDSIISVQPSLPPQKEMQKKIESKDEVSSFAKKMDEQPSAKVKVENSKKEDALQEEQHENVVHVSFPKKVENLTQGEDSKKDTVEELLLAVSEQMVALEQLHVQPTLLYQYIQKIQEMYQSYGNVKLNELPAAELQQLQAFAAKHNIENLLCLEDTIKMMLQKLMLPDKLQTFTKNVQTEVHDLMKASTGNEVKAETAFSAEKENVVIDDKLKKEFLAEPTDVNSGEEAGSQQLKPSFIESLSAAKSDKATQTETVTVPELGKKLEGKVELLQKFVVKQERVLFQLNPDKLGSVTVYMKKQGDHIQVHVEMEKHDVKKNLEIIFDELRHRLKEKEIQIEISYADREQKREEQQERHQRRKQDEPMKQEQKQEKQQDFAGLLEE